MGCLAFACLCLVLLVLPVYPYVLRAVWKRQSVQRKASAGSAPSTDYGVVVRAAYLVNQTAFVATPFNPVRARASQSVP
ncbi:hypothetical protein V8C37DRAFT_395056 [Trichoderma ceciliae]